VKRLMAGVALAVALMATTTQAGGSTPDRAARTAPVTFRVQGNRFVDGSGRTLRLRGVDRSGMEYACVQGWGIADGPMDQSSVDAMATWDINAVRLPLNEDCWLGINGVSPAYSGAAYRQAVAAYVAELHQDGIVIILDLHAPGYQTAGMQSLVNAVRATGATEPVMIAPIGWAGAAGGPDQYGSDPTQGWLKWRPTDPAGQEIMSWHVYNFTGCAVAGCWTSEVLPVAATFPVVTGEPGETDCSTAFDVALMNWDDAHGISYVAWAWNHSPDTCGDAGPSVVTSFSGAPTKSGASVESHYRAVGMGPAPTKMASIGFLVSGPAAVAPSCSAAVACLVD
jgi:endoglucanase